MIDHRPPPPPAEICLVRTYASRGVKGGTLIAEDVTDIESHERLLCNGGYRPQRCPPCGAAMHVHDYRPRELLASGLGSATVVRFRCADRDGCGAVFLVLPALIARHLWRAWATVEATTTGTPAAAEPVPARTARRWVARLLQCGAALVVALGASALGTALAGEVGLGGTRGEVVAAYVAAASPTPPRGRQFAALAGLVHRVAPGLRLV